MWGLGHAGTYRVVMVKRRRLCCGYSRRISLSLHRVRSSVAVNSSHSSASYTCPRLIRGVIEQSPNIVDKERIQLLCNLLLVGKLQGTFEWYPGFVSITVVEQGNTTTHHTPLRCIGPILTTCRVFSLFKIPSRRPRVIPATLRSFVPLIMWLSDK